MLLRLEVLPDLLALAQEAPAARQAALRNRGRLAAFAFAQSTAEIDPWINTNGPVVVDTTWTNDMFNPDADGFVKPTGGTAGGHCYVMLDRLDDHDAYVFQNSWGTSWGLNGRFKIKRADFDSLLQDQGEACCAAELAPVTCSATDSRP